MPNGATGITSPDVAEAASELHGTLSTVLKTHSVGEDVIHLELRVFHEEETSHMMGTSDYVFLKDWLKKRTVKDTFTPRVRPGRASGMISPLELLRERKYRHIDPWLKEHRSESLIDYPARNLDSLDRSKYHVSERISVDC